MDQSTTLTAGLSGTATLAVGIEDTAITLGSGDVEVLGTPRVVALAEQAACQAVAATLDADMTTVGVRIELDHLRATQVGRTVTATATLETVEGRKLDFTITVVEDDVEVARGLHRRVIAPRSAFAG